ncbi:DUF2326 domain-containing protein [Agrobacterium tumefaciens]|uniref:DUF2326 domain-containing protein n=1 Tax=Agrobacterium tumefaciens TaxID=358 RepID=UPI0027E42EE2|nr:DUF2326 domain-containing protein [Agrobacterium tumefaciens]
MKLLDRFKSSVVFGVDTHSTGTQDAFGVFISTVCRLPFGHETDVVDCAKRRRAVPVLPEKAFRLDTLQQVRHRIRLAGVFHRDGYNLAVVENYAEVTDMLSPYSVGIAIQQHRELGVDGLASFQVAEHYEEMIAEASQAKNLLEKLSVEAASLKSSLDFIEESLEAEKPGDGEAIAALYRAVGTELPGSVVKSFEDIADFHQSVADNRRFHLSSQLDAIRRRISAVTVEMNTARARRDEILRDLKGKGAFSDLAAMQKVAAEKSEKHARLQTQYEEALEVEAGRAARKIQESNLLARLQNDLRTREATVSAMVLAVMEAKKALYADRGASFEVQATVNGPHFRVNIDGSRSGGIANMEIFCFDYALYKLTTARLGGPGFLIHDSHLFDPVDSRQIATAIQLGSGLVDDVGGQYIVMLNTDMFDRLPFDDDFDVKSKIMNVRLDDTDRGGLFGFRFK